MPDAPPLTDAQRVLVERVQPRVAKIANAVCRLLPNADAQDLVSAGYEGLIRAAQRYDPEMGVPFHAYAHYRIRGAMIDFSRSQSPGARNRRRAEIALERSQELLERAMEDQDAAARITQEEKVARARRIIEKASVALLMSRAGHEPEQAADTSLDQEQALLKQETKRRVREVLEKFSGRDRQILEKLYIDGKSMRQVATELDTHASTVSRRHSFLLGRCSRLLADLGPP